MVFKERKTYCYLIDNEGFLRKVLRDEAEKLVDNKRWFYTTKKVYLLHTNSSKFNINGFNGKVNSNSLVYKTTNVSYLTGDKYDVKYIVYPPKKVNWDKIIEANRKAEKPKMSKHRSHKDTQRIPMDQWEAFKLKHPNIHFDRYEYRVTKNGQKFMEKVIIHTNVIV